MTREAVDPKIAASVAAHDRDAHTALAVLRILIDVMIAGFDGDELDDSHELEDLMEERDAAITGLVDVARERGASAQQCAQMHELLRRLWDESPSIKEWLRREFTITGA